MLAGFKSYKSNILILNKKNKEQDCCYKCKKNFLRYSLLSKQLTNYFSKKFYYIYLISFDNFVDLSVCSEKCISKLTADISLFLSIRALSKSYNNILKIHLIDKNQYTTYYDYIIFIKLISNFYNYGMC